MSTPITKNTELQRTSHQPLDGASTPSISVVARNALRRETLSPEATHEIVQWATTGLTPVRVPQQQELLESPAAAGWTVGDLLYLSDWLDHGGVVLSFPPSLLTELEARGLIALSPITDDALLERELLAQAARVYELNNHEQNSAGEDRCSDSNQHESHVKQWRTALREQALQELGALEHDLTSRYHQSISTDGTNYYRTTPTQMLMSLRSSFAGQEGSEESLIYGLEGLFHSTPAGQPVLSPYALEELETRLDTLPVDQQEVDELAEEGWNLQFQRWGKSDPGSQWEFDLSALTRSPSYLGGHLIFLLETIADPKRNIRLSDGLMASLKSWQGVDIVPVEEVDHRDVWNGEPEGEQYFEGHIVGPDSQEYLFRYTPQVGTTITRLITWAKAHPSVQLLTTREMLELFNAPIRLEAHIRQQDQQIAHLQGENSFLADELDEEREMRSTAEGDAAYAEQETAQIGQRLLLEQYHTDQLLKEINRPTPYPHTPSARVARPVVQGRRRTQALTLPRAIAPQAAYHAHMTAGLRRGQPNQQAAIDRIRAGLSGHSPGIFPGG